jgi:hypothetical protein
VTRFLFVPDPAEPWPGDAVHDDTKRPTSVDQTEWRHQLAADRCLPGLSRGRFVRRCLPPKRLRCAGPSANLGSHPFDLGPPEVAGGSVTSCAVRRSASSPCSRETPLLRLDPEMLRTFSSEHPGLGQDLLFALGRVRAFRMRRGESRRAASNAY